MAPGGYGGIQAELPATLCTLAVQYTHQGPGIRHTLFRLQPVYIYQYKWTLQTPAQHAYLATAQGALCIIKQPGLLQISATSRSAVFR